MLVIDRLTFRYTESEHPIFKNISLSLRKGEFVSLIGSSGSGKSTLLKIIAGLMEGEDGHIYYEGYEGNRLGKIGYMPQKDQLLPWRKIIENVLLPVEIRSSNKEVEKEKATALLKEFGLSEVANEYPSRLSGGMRQRAAFLRTIMTGSDLLLLDEPFGALDAMRKQDMQRWLLSVWERLGKTIFFITHDIEEAILLSDRVLVLRDGEIEEVSIPFSRPRVPDMIFGHEFIEYRRLLSEKIREKNHL